ncbi:glycoside hydrolase family 25 protein [Pelomyxa schiedti]|nr:glycoside hydrolase family 25 protein [Pelomyxa schiedti]
MKRRLVTGFLLVCLWVGISECVTGVDISLYAEVQPSDWECLYKNGFRFATVQCWNCGYYFGEDTAYAVQTAWDAGFEAVDVYVFMAPKCIHNSNATLVVDWIYGNLTAQAINYGKIWFDIEECPSSSCWQSTSANAQYMHEAAKRADSLGMTVGFYSSVYEWGVVMGSDASFSSYLQWYAHWDENPSFSDTPKYNNYGGWVTPYMKQYWDAGPCSGIDTDVNYRDNI